MKKNMLLAVTALSLACLSSQSLTAHAISSSTNANTKYCFAETSPVITYKFCIPQNLSHVIEDFFSSSCLPENNCPDSNLPENNIPDSNLPENNIPMPNLPEGNSPGTNIPDAGSPENTPPAPEIPVPEDEIPEDTASSRYIAQIVSLVNAERAKAGLSPVTVNTQVQTAALIRAKECEQSFSHTRPNGSSFATALKEQNVSYRSAGENIAWGQRTPEAVMNAWMNSDGHRANIMNPNFTSIGVGHYQNENGINYWCQLFIR